MNDPLIGGFYLIIVIFLVVLAILWFILPFAIFGTKAKLDLLISEMRQLNAELKRLGKQLAASSKQVPPVEEALEFADPIDALAQLENQPERDEQKDRAQMEARLEKKKEQENTAVLVLIGILVIVIFIGLAVWVETIM